jgi:hypothetical protein
MGRPVCASRATTIKDDKMNVSVTPDQGGWEEPIDE